MMRHMLTAVILGCSLASVQAAENSFEYFFAGAKSLTVSSDSSIDGILGLSFEEARGGILAITAFPLYSRGGDGLEAWSPLSSTRWLASRDAGDVGQPPGNSIVLRGAMPLPRLLPPPPPMDFSSFKIGAGGSISLGGGQPSIIPPVRPPVIGGSIQLSNGGGISIDNGGVVFGEGPSGIGLLPNVMPAVPEPAPALMLSLGGLLLLARRRRA